MTSDYRIREARPHEELSVRRLLDAAVLAYDSLEDRLEAGEVLVATARSDDSDERLLGTVVLEPRDRGAHVEAIAVRRRQRARGIGTALIEVALEREGALTATFEARVRPFYRSLGFTIERLEDDRYRGAIAREQ